MKIDVGDYVQYRTAKGVIKGRGLVIRVTEYWHILVDQRTGKKEHWSDDLMRKLTL